MKKGAKSRVVKRKPNELQRFLRSKKIKIRFGWVGKDKYGEINHSRGIVTIGIHLMVTDILVHEFMHHKYPYLSERRIDQKARRYVKRMSVRQIHLIAKQVSRIANANAQKGY
jgi:riboflavin synthase